MLYLCCYVYVVNDLCKKKLKSEIINHLAVGYG